MKSTGLLAALLWLIANTLQFKMFFLVLNLLISGWVINHHNSGIWLPLWRVIRWLLLPIILLHGLMTPGAVMLSLGEITVTEEGLEQGMILALHLINLFLTGLMFAYLVSPREWMQLLKKHPGIYKRLLPYLLLLQSMLASHKLLLAKLSDSWKQQGKRVTQLPSILVSMIHQSQKMADSGARSTWSNWEAEIKRLGEYSKTMDTGMKWLFLLLSTVEIGLHIYG